MPPPPFESLSFGAPPLPLTHHPSVPYLCVAQSLHFPAAPSAVLPFRSPWKGRKREIGGGKGREGKQERERERVACYLPSSTTPPWEIEFTVGRQGEIWVVVLPLVPPLLFLLLAVSNFQLACWWIIKFWVLYFSFSKLWKVYLLIYFCCWCLLEICWDGILVQKLV